MLASESPELEDGWLEATDPSGKKYYYNSRNVNEVTWDRPVKRSQPKPAQPVGASSSAGALPAGWKSAIDPASGKMYYYEESNPGHVTWERPTGSTEAAHVVLEVDKMNAAVKGKQATKPKASGAWSHLSESAASCHKGFGKLSFKAKAGLAGLLLAVVVIIIIVAATAGSKSKYERDDFAESARLPHEPGVSAVRRPLEIWNDGKRTSVDYAGDVLFNSTFNLIPIDDPFAIIRAEGTGTVLVALENPDLAKQVADDILSGKPASAVIVKLRDQWAVASMVGEVNLLLDLQRVTDHALPNFKAPIGRGSVLFASPKVPKDVLVNKFKVALPGTYMFAEGGNLKDGVVHLLLSALLSALEPAVNRLFGVDFGAAKPLIDSLKPSGNLSIALGISTTSEYTEVYLRHPVDSLVLPGINIPGVESLLGSLEVWCRFKGDFSCKVAVRDFRLGDIFTKAFEALLENGQFIIRECEDFFRGHGKVLIIVSERFVKDLSNCLVTIVTDLKKGDCQLFSLQNIKSTYDDIEKGVAVVADDIKRSYESDIKPLIKEIGKFFDDVGGDIGDFFDDVGGWFG